MTVPPEIVHDHDDSAPKADAAAATRKRRRLVLGAIVGGLLVIGVLAANSSPARRWALGRVLAVLETHGVRAEAEALDWNLIDLRFRILGLSLTAGPPDAPPFFVAEELEIDLPWAALRGDPAVESLSVSGGRVRLRRNAESNWALPVGSGATSESPGSTLGWLPIGRLEVTGLLFELVDEAVGMRAELRDISLMLGPTESATEIAGPLASGSGRIDAFENEITVEGLEATLHYDGRGLRIEGLSLSAPPLMIDADAAFTDIWSAAAVRADASIRADAGDLAGLAGVEAAVRGSLAVRVAATTPLAALEASWQIDGRELQINEVAGIGLSASGGLTGDTIEVGTLTIENETARLEGSGSWTLATGGGELRAAWTEIDLDSLLAAILGDMTPRPATFLDGELTATWSEPVADALSLRFDGRLRPGNAGPRAVPLAGSATLLKPAGEGADMQLEIRGGAAEWATFNGELRASRPGDLTPESLLAIAVDGTGDLEITDLTAALARLEDLDLIGALPEAMKPAGAAAAAWRLAGSIGEPRLAADIVADGISLGDVLIEEASAVLSLDAGGARLSGLAIRSGINTLVGGGLIGGADGDLDLRLDAVVPDLVRLLPADVVDAWRLRGGGTADVAVTGTPAAPIATANVDIRGLEIAGQHVASAAAELRLDGDTVRIVSARLAQEDTGLLTARGETTYDGAVVVLEAELARFALEPVPSTSGVPAVPLQAVVDGRIALRREGGPTSVSGGLQLGETTWGTVSLGSVDLEMTTDASRVTLVANVPALAANASASFAVAAPGLTTIDLAFDDLDLAAVETLLPTSIALPLTGVLSAHLALEGDLADPSTLSASLELRRLNADIGDTTVRLSSPGRIEYGPTGAEADVTVAIGNASMSVTRAVRDGAGELTATLAGDLADIDDLVSIGRELQRAAGAEFSGEAPEPFVARGPFRIVASLRGNASDPDLSFEAAVEDATLRWGDLPAAAHMNVRISGDNEIVVLDRFETVWLDAAIAASGEIPVAVLAATPFSLGGPPIEATTASVLRSARLDVRVDGLTIAGIAPLFDPTLAERGEGRVSATASFLADSLDLPSVRGEIVFEEAFVAAAGTSLAQRTPTRLGLADGILTALAFDWTGPGGDFGVGGGVAFGVEPTYDLTIFGDVDLRTVRLLLPSGIASTGRVGWTARVTGSGVAPVVAGRIDLRGAELQVSDPRLRITDLAGAILLQPGSIVVDGIEGTANGGRLALNGEITYENGAVTGGEIRLDGTDLALEIPEGLRTVVDVALLLRPGEQPLTLAGDVTVVRGTYRRPLRLTAGLLDALVRGTGTTSGSGGPLDDLRLDLRILTEDDVLVDNNLARLQIAADLRIGGTPASPTLTGRAELGEGGQVFLGGNIFRIETASVDFVDPTGVAAELDLSAMTVVSNYEIRLDASGPPDTLEIELSSVPALDRSDLVSVLVTGRTLGQAGGMQTQVAGEQVAGFLTGELTSRAGRAIGLDAVRVERSVGDEQFDPALVANEADPSMRLTLSKRFDDLELVFSQNVREAGGYTWIVSYRVLRNIRVRAVSRDNNDRSYEASHDLRFGGGSQEATARTEERRVGRVTVSGVADIPESEVRGRLQLSSGDRFDIFRWQDDRDRIERLYQDRGYLEADVRTRRREHPEAGTVDLLYDVRRGPATRIEIEGHELSADTVRLMEIAWRQSVIDEFLVEELDRLAREALVAQRYLSPAVDVQITAEDAGVKVARVTVIAGGTTSERRIEPRGNSRLGAGILRAYLRNDGIERAAWIDPTGLAAGVEDLYRQHGFLDTRVHVAAPRREGDEIVLPIEIEEGPQYRVAGVSIAGAGHRSTVEIAATAGLVTGTVWVADGVRRAQRAIEALYRSEGFSAVAVEASAVLGDGGAVDVTLVVHEGPRQVIERIEVTGASRTNVDFIRSRLGVQAGEPIDLRALYEGRRRLYDSGVFRRVDVAVEPSGSTDLPPAVDPDTTGSLELSKAQTVPVVVNVRLEERPRYRFRYGLGVTDQRVVLTDMVERDLDFGASTDFVDHNLFGRAITTGGSLRYDTDNQAARGYVSAPTFFGLPLTSTAFVFRSREKLRAAAIIPFVADRAGLTLEQRFRVADLVDIAYSYAFERNHTFEENLDPDNPFAFDITVDIARLTLGGFLDRRDDIFDSTRGWSHSSTFEHSAPSLGSDLRFVRYLAQQTYFHPIGRGVVLGSAARLGLATAFGDALIPSERFFAGGGNSVRGYAEDSLGPTDFFGDPTGGEALLVLKQEVRFPLPWVFRGVGFFDAGNVYETVGDLTITNLKTSWGLGLRVDTPIVLLRFDYGVRIGRAPGEPLGRFFFSIGQAF